MAGKVQWDNVHESIKTELIQLAYTENEAFLYVITDFQHTLILRQTEQTLFQLNSKSQLGIRLYQTYPLITLETQKLSYTVRV